MLLSSLLYSCALCQQAHFEFPKKLGADMASKVLGSDPLELDLNLKDFGLLEEVLDSAYTRSPREFIAQLQPQSPRAPPLKVSRKAGFETHKHPDFPNYELRIQTPKLGLDSVKHYTGYIDILSEDKHLFFWLYESRSDPAKDPVVLWTNGGPGCSSALGQFFEMGPSLIDTDLRVHYNEYAWNSNATMIFLDQPVNVGYSYSSQRVSSSKLAGEDVYSFLEVLFDALPQYSGLPFHISGESYGGKYLPAIGKAILNHPERSFDLQSVLIGNPITDPAIQAFSTVAMACGDGGYPSVLDEDTCLDLWDKVPYCESLLNMCYDTDNNQLVCAAAKMYCRQLEEPYLATGRNRLDISDLCYDQCYPEFQSIQDYLRLPEVIEATGSDVDNFESCSASVMSDFSAYQDQTRNEGPDVLSLLDAGVDVLFYEGNLDWVCSWPGVYRVVERLRYEKHAEFTAEPLKTWFVDGKPAGETKAAGKLTWLKVYEAGHMIPYDQPYRALTMFNQWLRERHFE